MKVTIHRLPDALTLDQIAIKLFQEFGNGIHIDNIGSEQDEKPLHVQAAEILGHIHNRDYGLAESKAGLLRDQLRKGDWTLGGGKTEECIDEKDAMLEKQGREILCLRDMYDGVWNKVHALEAELSVRKDDSDVLMKVVEIVKEWKNLSAMVSTYDMRYLRDVVSDYLDAPPETPIDESTDIIVTFRGLLS